MNHYTKKLQEDRKIIRKLNIRSYVYGILFALVTGSLIGLFLGFYPFESRHTLIHYDNLSALQQNESTHIIDSIKPLYLRYASSITITDNITKYCQIQNCDGLNSGGRIVAMYHDDTMLLRRNICHELLHSVVFPPIGEVFTKHQKPSNIHEVIYDLENYYPCYNDIAISISLSPTEPTGAA